MLHPIIQIAREIYLSGYLFLLCLYYPKINNYSSRLVEGDWLKKNQLPEIAENILLTRATGPPEEITALERQIRLQTPMAPAKAAVIKVPSLYSSLSAVAES
jgi:hypothetical protein